MQLHLRAHAPCPSSIGRGSSKPAPCLHLRPRSVCRAWDSEETAARWQELPDVRQPSIQEQGPSSSLLPADPQATLQRVLEVVRTGNLDGMLEFCSDEVIDKLLALKQTPGWVIDLVQPVKQLSQPATHRHMPGGCMMTIILAAIESSNHPLLAGHLLARHPASSCTVEHDQDGHSNAWDQTLALNHFSCQQ